MLELDEDRRRPVPEADPKERADELTAAAARLHDAIEGLNRAFLGGAAVEKAAARDRFEVALAAYAALIEAA